MRKIKFRGKRINNETREFVYGALFKGETENGKPLAYIIPCGTRYEVMNGRLHRNTPLHEVDTETVGQFTGLKDDGLEDEKNKREIYEGDRVRATNKSGWTREFEIIWNEDEAKFMVREGSQPNISFDLTCDAIIDFHVVVIGDISQR